MSLVQLMLRLPRRPISPRLTHTTTSFLLVLLLVPGCLSETGARDADKNKSGQTAGPASPTPPKSRNTDPDAPPVADAPKADDTPGADYVPCKLTLAQLRMLQRPEVAQTLSPADAEQLQSSVVDAAVRKGPKPEMTGPWVSDLIEALASKNTAARLTGLAPSQALASILEIVRKNRDQVATAADVAWYATIIRDAINSKSGSTSAVTSTENALRVPYDRSAYAYPDSSKSSPSKTPDGGSKFEALMKSLDSLEPRPADPQKPNLLLVGTPRSSLYSVVTEKVLTSQLERGDKSLVIQELKKSRPLDAQELIDAARQFLLTLERPKDIGCSMSLLTWREVEFAFGYLIANEYIAVQVVVRNLSDKQQFVLHDVEFEVDADPTGRLGRYYSGRDKVVVRALANTQASGDPRNITLNTATGIGQVMAAAQTIFGGQLADAAGVFNGGFLPGLKNAWKDLSGDQMKMIDDNTFSSTPSSQTVVPKSGTVVFYTFIPSKQFEEGWWTQPCVETMYEGRLDSGGRLSNLSRGTYGQQVPLPGSANDQRMSSIPGSADIPTGVDVRRALEVCARLPVVPERQHSRWSTLWTKGVLLQKTPEGDLQTMEIPYGEAGTGTDTAGTDVVAHVSPKGQTQVPSPGYAYELFRTAYRRPYKKWSGNSLAIFRELSNTVVAGVHTLDASDVLPSISALDCGTQVDDKGTVDFSKVMGDTLSCSLTGKNLSSLPKVRLRNAADGGADGKFAESNVIVIGDPTKATVSWPVATLHGLPGTTYLLYGVTTLSAEQKTSAALHLPDTPFAAAVTNASSSGTIFDFSQDGNAVQVLTVTGNHLDQVTGLVLSPAVDTKLADKAAEDQETAKITAAKAAAVKAAEATAVAEKAKSDADTAAAAKVAADKRAKAAPLDKAAAAAAKVATAKASKAAKTAAIAKAAADKAANPGAAEAVEPNKIVGSLDNQASSKRQATKPIQVADKPGKTVTQVSFNLNAKDLTTLGNGGATLTLKTADDTKQSELDDSLGITVKLPAK